MCIRIAASVFLLSCLAGCIGSGMEPLDPAAAVLEARASRSALGPGKAPYAGGTILEDPGWADGPEVLPVLLGRLVSSNPRIREARASASAAADIARTGSPWGDPFIEAGPSASPGRTSGVGWSAAVGFTLPIGGRAGREADALMAKSGVAGVSLRAVAAQEAAELRKALALAMCSASAIKTASEGLDWARKGTVLAGKTAAAGGGSALDVNLAQVEERSANMALLEARDRHEQDLAALAGLLSLSIGALPALPTLPDRYPGPAAPAPGRILGVLALSAPELVRLEAACDAADRSLAVERSRSVPDLEVGAQVDAEAGEQGATVGLRLGLSVPLFDGNAAGVAAARAAASEARAAYCAVADRLLSALETLESRASGLRKRLNFLDTELLPDHAAALESAARAMEHAGFEPLRYIEMQRSLREWTLGRDELMRELIEVTAEMERLAGAPLYRLPGR